MAVSKNVMAGAWILPCLQGKLGECSPHDFILPFHKAVLATTSTKLTGRKGRWEGVSMEAALEHG